jgi:putative RecB family exonuclease
MEGVAVSTFSHSRIEAFETCPKKYEFAYLLKVPRAAAGVEAFMGSRVHEALEWLYGEVKACRVPTADEVVAEYLRLWGAAWTDDVRITRAGRTQEDYRSIGEKAVHAYHHRYEPFDQDVTVGLEARITLKLDDDHDLCGYVDRVAKVADGVWEVHDYKTSSSLVTQQKADADRQLALYAIAVREMYPDARDVALVWHYVTFDTEVRSSRTSEQLEALRVDVLGKIRHIEAQSSFPAKTSSLCDWCEYKPLCPAWRHLYETAALPEDQRPLEEGSVLVNEYLQVSDELSALKSRQEALKDRIAARAAADGLDRLFGAAGSVKVFRYPCISLPDAKDLRRAALEAEVREAGLWDRFAALSSYQLSRALQDGTVPPEVAVRLEPYLTHSDGVKLYPSPRRE